MKPAEFRDRRISRELGMVIGRVAGDSADRPRGRASPTLIGADVAAVPSDYVDRRPRSKIGRLLQLEADLAELLATSAPATWRAMRRTVRRLIRQARLELRAADQELS